MHRRTAYRALGSDTIGVEHSYLIVRDANRVFALVCLGAEIREAPSIEHKPATHDHERHQTSSEVSSVAVRPKRTDPDERDKPEPDVEDPTYLRAPSRFALQGSIKATMLTLVPSKPELKSIRRRLRRQVIAHSITSGRHCLANLLVDCEPARVRRFAVLRPVLATRRIDGDCSRNPLRHSAWLRAKAMFTIPRQLADRRGYAQVLARNHSARPTARGPKCFVIARFWVGGSVRTLVDTRQARAYPLAAGSSGSHPCVPEPYACKAQSPEPKA